MGHPLAPLSLLVLVVAGVYGTPHGGLPSVGSVWGPVRTHIGIIRSTANHSHYYILEEGDVIRHPIKEYEMFENRMEMYDYMQSKLGDDAAVLKFDSQALEGKYLEVLSSKKISLDSVKLICHSHKMKTPFCHVSWPIVNLLYSTVRRTDDGTVFPVVFFSHKGCKKDSSCFWITHVNEVVVLDKNIV